MSNETEDQNINQILQNLGIRNLEELQQYQDIIRSTVDQTKKEKIRTDILSNVRAAIEDTIKEINDINLEFSIKCSIENSGIKSLEFARASSDSWQTTVKYKFFQNTKPCKLSEIQGLAGITKPTSSSQFLYKLLKDAGNTRYTFKDFIKGRVPRDEILKVLKSKGNYDVLIEQKKDEV